MNETTGEKITDEATIRELIAGHETWYHQIELAPGIVTPGSHRSSRGLRFLDRLGLPREGAGRRVLDVGCRDGFFAFEMERRGFEVVGIDYADPEVTGFGIAQRILGSRIEYRTENVYDLDPDRHGTFDVVLFLGVLYHLRNPLMALDRVRAVTAEGGEVFVETQLASDRAVKKSKLPLWRFYPRDSLAGDASNKWAPNLPGLKVALEESQFEVVDTAVDGDRGLARGRAVADHFLEYHRRLDASSGMYGRP